ncbi:MAG TPA: hemerythrin domain-containing protein [Fibrobacteria bacterium]|nr:hemerythrin domain-containing protein [Fibrobacteria bacterium]
MILSSSQTIKQILRQRPLAAEALEQEFGALFWDRMETPLSNLCTSAGVDSHSLLEKIIALPVSPADTRWDKKPIYWLVDHLALDHVAFRDIDMPSIVALIEEERMPAYPDGYVVKLLLQEFRHFQADFTRHMAEEEEFLFPKIMRNEACFRYPELGPQVFRGSVNLYLKLETHRPEEEFKHMIISIREKLRNQHMHRPAAELAQRAQAAMDGFAGRLLAHAELETDLLFPRAGRLEQELYENSAPGISRYPEDQK